MNMMYHYELPAKNFVPHVSFLRKVSLRFIMYTQCDEPSIIVFMDSWNTFIPSTIDSKLGRSNDFSSENYNYLELQMNYDRNYWRNNLWNQY